MVKKDGMILEKLIYAVGFPNLMQVSIANSLIEFFHLLEVEDDTIGENDRNEFLKSIEKKK